MKTVEFVVLIAFGAFWFVFFILLCYYASRKRRTEERRDHWRGNEDEYKSHSQQYVGAIGWFQRYRSRQEDGKHELELL